MNIGYMHMVLQLSFHCMQEYHLSHRVPQWIMLLHQISHTQILCYFHIWIGKMCSIMKSIRYIHCRRSKRMHFRISQNMMLNMTHCIGNRTLNCIIQNMHYYMLMVHPGMQPSVDRNLPVVDSAESFRNEKMIFHLPFVRLGFYSAHYRNHIRYDLLLQIHMDLDYDNSRSQALHHNHRNNLFRMGFLLLHPFLQTAYNIYHRSFDMEYFCLDLVPSTFFHL